MDILAAVYRHQFDHNRSSATSLKDVEVYFLSFADDQDPREEVLRRFVGHTPPVAPISEEDAGSSEVTHGTSGGRGIILRAHRIRWVDGDTVEVEGGYFEDSRSAAASTYRLVRRGGTWFVVAEEVNWIS